MMFPLTDSRVASFKRFQRLALLAWLTKSYASVASRLTFLRRMTAARHFASTVIAAWLGWRQADRSRAYLSVCMLFAVFNWPSAALRASLSFERIY